MQNLHYASSCEIQGVLNNKAFNCFINPKISLSITILHQRNQNEPSRKNYQFFQPFDSYENKLFTSINLLLNECVLNNLKYTRDPYNCKIVIKKCSVSDHIYLSL